MFYRYIEWMQVANPPYISSRISYLANGQAHFTELNLCRRQLQERLRFHFWLKLKINIFTLALLVTIV